MYVNDQPNLDDIKNDVLEDNNAQTIFNHLQELENLGGDHEKRWFWELLQNAEDSVSDSSQVLVELEYNDDKLVFKHNGTPFKHEEIIHLIYHGSTKKGEKNKTGKFGTGFLTTHLLSKKVGLSGILENGTHFSFTLDRDGKSSDEIRHAMEKSWEQFKNNSQQHSSHYSNRFTSFFEYKLTEKSHQRVKLGLDNLEYLVPFVLAFNNKIEEFSLKIGSKQTVYKKVNIIDERSEKVQIIPINKTETDIVVESFVAVITDGNTTVAHPVSKTANNSYKIDRLPNNIPKLFYHFPLIGTEDFGLPVIINSFSFRPKTERDGIFLGTEDRDDININKQLIRDAIKLIIELARFASEQKWENLFEIALIQTIKEQRWLDVDWFKDNLNNLLLSIREICLVLSPTGNLIAPESAQIPIGTNSHKLWVLMHPLFKDQMPTRELADKWSHVLHSWATLNNSSVSDMNEACDIRKLVKNLAMKANTKILSSYFSSTDNQPEDIQMYNWLNSLYELINEMKVNDVFGEFSILPNQNGQFCKRSGDLFFDENIDEGLKHILHRFGRDRKNQLLDRKIVIDKTLLPVKNENDILQEAIDEAYKRSGDSNLTVDINEAIRDLFVWLVIRGRCEKLDGFPVFCRKQEDSKEIIQKLSTHQKILIPIEHWDVVFQNYADLFPKDFIISSIYSDKIQTEDWKKLASSNLVFTNPLFIENRPLKKEEIRLLLVDKEEIADDDEIDHSINDCQVSNIAFLDLQDKGLIDTSRKSRSKAKRFIEFIILCLAYADNKWFLQSTFQCECNKTHNINPSIWLYHLKNRLWVYFDANKAEQPSATNISPLIAENQAVIAALKEDKPFRLMNKLSVSVGDLIRNIVAQSDEERLSWDKTYSQILTSIYSPEELGKLLNDPDFKSQYDQYKQKKEKLGRNQQIGYRVEELFKKLFESEHYKSMGITISRTGYGSDYELEHDYIENNEEQVINIDIGTRKWLIELKATNKNFASMTPLQGKTAVENSGDFALCVVPLINNEELTVQYLETNAKFILNIGELLKTDVNSVDLFKNFAQFVTKPNERIEIEISEGQIRYKVKQIIWENGLSVRDFVSFIISSKLT